MDADWYRLELLREILVEDPQTRQTHTVRTFLIYDPLRNLWFDSFGSSSAFRNNLFYPFASEEVGRRKVQRLNTERLKNRQRERDDPAEWPGEKGIIGKGK